MGARYYRGFLMEADTFGQDKPLLIRSSDDLQAKPFTPVVHHKGQSQIEYAFNTPFVSHLVRHESTDLTPWILFGIKWTADDWPELTNEFSPWMNMDTQGAKYIRGAVIPMDTNGAPVTLKIVGTGQPGDVGVPVTLDPITTPAVEKTPVAVSFTVPIVTHEIQIQPQQDVRVWYDEIRWDFDPWPELIDEATGWMPVLQGGGAAFLQGLILPIETGAVLPELILSTDTGSDVPLVPHFTPPPFRKRGVPYSLATPTVCHQVQIIPSVPCRIWTPEIQWVAEPTPDLATTWTTQFTAHGMIGYQHIARIEAAYAATDPVTLTITSFDGASPAPLTLPGTGGVYQKLLLTLTPNKGQLYRYSAVSTGTFQMYLNDFVVHVGPWNRIGPYVPYRLLGAQFGDRARI